MFDSDDDEISLISDASFSDPLASTTNGAAPKSTSDLSDPPSIAAVPIIDDMPVVEIASSDEDDDDDNSRKSQNFPTTNDDDEFLMAEIPVECMVAIENNSDDDLMVEIPSPNSNKNELQSDASSSASSSRKSSKRENELRKKRNETLKQIETYNAKKAEMLARVSFCYDPEASLVKKNLKETRKERRARLRAENRSKFQPRPSKVSEAIVRSQRAAKQAALDQLNKERQESYREKREKARKAQEDALLKNANRMLEREMQLHELQKLQLLKKQSKSIAQKLINSRVTSTELRQSGEEKTIKKVTPDGTVHEFSIKLFDNEDDFINHNLSLNYALFMS